MDATILPPGTAVTLTNRIFKVNDHIRFHGLNPRLKADKQRYASWLEEGKVSEPMGLRVKSEAGKEALLMVIR